MRIGLLVIVVLCILFLGWIATPGAGYGLGRAIAEAVLFLRGIFG